MSNKVRNFDLDDYEFSEFEDDQTVSFSKMTSKPKKYKGHQSKHQNKRDDKWGDSAPTDSAPGADEEPIKSFSDVEAEERKAQWEAERAKSDIENTHEIRGIAINFNGVLKMEKVNSTFKDKPSYGIKFYFKGKNNSFKHIWFNQKQRERDMVFQKESEFLEKVLEENEKRSRKR